MQVYSGKDNLPGHFVPRLKLALPAAAAYWIHALGGVPLLFQQLQAKGIAVLTWIKGPQEERWPAGEFAAATIPVRSPGGPGVLEGQVAERKLELEFGRSKTVLEAREIRFQGDRRLRGQGRNGQPRKPLELAGKPRAGQRQPSILTTHPSLPAEQVAGLLRSRWSQENFFKYMREEFGLDTLPGHALEEVDEDAWVVNPAWRAIEKALKKERNAVGHLRRKRALEAAADSDAARELDARIQASEQAVEGLVRVRKRTAQHVRAGELTAEQRLQALPEPLRALTDTLRMIAYRAETAMAAAVAPEPGNPDTARSLLKALFQTDASLLPDPAAGTLTVRLLHQATRARDAALAPLFDELNRTRTVFPGTNLRLVYEILPAEPSPPPASPPRPPPLSADNLCNLNETV